MGSIYRVIIKMCCEMLRKCNFLNNDIPNRRRRGVLPRRCRSPGGSPCQFDCFRASANALKSFWCAWYVVLNNFGVKLRDPDMTKKSHAKS